MNNLLILSCKWYINTFKNLPITVLNKQFIINFFLLTLKTCLQHSFNKFRKLKEKLFA